MNSGTAAGNFDCVILCNTFREFEAMSGLMRPLGIQTYRATMWEQAELLIARINPTVLVLEFDFLDGAWAVALRILTMQAPTVSVILTSDSTSAGFWIYALEHGVYDVAPKPFHPKNLSRVLFNAHDHALTLRSKYGTAGMSRSI